MIEQSYTGWKIWKPTSEEWVEFYMTNNPPIPMLENEYLIVKTEDGITTYYCCEDGKMRKFNGGAIKTTVDTHVEEPKPVEGAKKKDGTERKPRKFSKGKSIVINPRNDEQNCAFDLIKDPTKTVKLITGT